MAMDPQVIKAAIDSFENDDFLHAKELVQGQVKQARNDFLKAKLGLKNDIEKQFVEMKPNENIGTTDPMTLETDDDPEPIVPKKKRLIPKKK
jgi:hypothetical protein